MVYLDPGSTNGWKAQRRSAAFPSGGYVGDGDDDYHGMMNGAVDQSDAIPCPSYAVSPTTSIQTLSGGTAAVRTKRLNSSCFFWSYMHVHLCVFQNGRSGDDVSRQTDRQTGVNLVLS